MAQTRRSTARGLEQVPSRRLSAVPAEEAASEAARRGKRRGRIKYRIFTLGLGLDMTMLFLILVLLAVGLVMMFSASYAYAYYYYGNSYYFILRQGMFALVGVVLMLAISTFDYHQLHKLNLPIFAVSILLLLMVLVFKGTSLAPNKGGAVRWLNLGFVEFQPSEIAKFALILMFAHLIALYGERMKTFRYGFLPFFGILGLICVLVIAEKHVSATVIICLIAFIMMFVGGTKFRYFAVIGGAAAAVIGALVLFSSKFAYSMNRVHGWLDPFNPPEGVDTWQTVQSLYAIGSGQLLGVGIGQSRQKYLYIPEPQNDFVFAVVCEELGFIGCTAIIVLLLLYLLRVLYIASKARDDLGRCMCFGFFGLIALQSVSNIGMCLALLPVMGVTLPFFSAGGSSAVCLYLGFGLIQSVYMHRPDANVPHLRSTRTLKMNFRKLNA